MSKCVEQYMSRVMAQTALTVTVPVSWWDNLLYLDSYSVALLAALVLICSVKNYSVKEEVCANIKVVIVEVSLLHT